MPPNFTALPSKWNDMAGNSSNLSRTAHHEVGHHALQAGVVITPRSNLCKEGHGLDAGLLEARPAQQRAQQHSNHDDWAGALPCCRVLQESA